MSRLKYYWHVFLALRKPDLQRTLTYRADFIFWAFISLMWTLFQFFFYSVLITMSGEIGGWTRPELWVLLSVYTIIDAFTWSVLYQNMSSYTTAVYDGSLSLMLTRPIPTQYLIMINRVSYTNITRLLTGVIMLIISLRNLNQVPTIGDVLIGIIFIIMAVLLIYFFWFILATLCFYVEKLDEVNEMVPALRRIWSFPRTIYTGGFALIFNTLVPLGLAASIPAESFLHRFDWPTALYLTVFVIALIWISHIFFQFSLKKYHGVGN